MRGRFFSRLVIGSSPFFFWRLYENRKFLAGEEAGTYIVPEQVTEADILDMALKHASGRLTKGRKIEQPSSAFSYLQTLMHEYEHEVFGVLFLDTKHRVIRFEELFKGTLDAASVYQGK